MNRTLSSIAVFAATLLAGCAHTMNFEPNPGPEGLPAVSKAPVHAGIYYSPEFANYVHVHKHGKVTTTVPIGAASVRYLDDLYARAFARTSRIGNPAGEALAAKGIDVVVSASLEHFDFPYGLAPYSARYSVAYRTTISTIEGVPVASWVVLGTADHYKMFRAVDGIVEAYMQDAGAKFLQGFERQSARALAAIAQQRSGKSAPIDAASFALAAMRTELAGLDNPHLARLRAAGALPVLVRSAQKTQRTLVVRMSDMRLRLDDGRLISPSTQSSLAELMALSDGSIDYFYPSLLGLAVVAGASANWHEERQSLHDNFGQLFFGDRNLRAGEDQSGAVFFLLPKESKGADGASLLAWVVDPDTADGVRVTLPLAAAR